MARKGSGTAFPMNPETKKQPANAMRQAMTLVFVTSSLKRMADMIMTSTGAKYRRMAAADMDVAWMVEK